MKIVGIVLCALLGIVSLHGQGDFLSPEQMSISSFTPATGRPGTVGTIRGEGFTPLTIHVHLGSLGSVRVHALNNAGTELKFRVPNAWNGQSAARLTVNTSSSSSTSSPRATSSGTFTPIALTITNFTPATGPPGTVITIRGTGFKTTASPNYIHFGSYSVSAHAVNGAGTELKF
ncbi:MAG: IPT/TIG domain-containing protein, partial [Cytophagales bacterium]|nr:IPT/TIG domain-containing protein [Cytophagales bacterium]